MTHIRLMTTTLAVLAASSLVILPAAEAKRKEKAEKASQQDRQYEQEKAQEQGQDQGAQRSFQSREDTPPGFEHGEKTGWDGADQPPGQERHDQ